METKILRFIVEGEPFGKERPRACKRGSFVTVYTPRKTVEYENKVRKSFLDQNNHTMIEGAVKVNINAFHKVPKAVSKKIHNSMIKGDIPCTVKPDADNIAKCILDPLNGVAFTDDNHVVQLSVFKRYGTTPRVEVEISSYKKGIINPLVFDPLFFIGG